MTNNRKFWRWFINAVFGKFCFGCSGSQVETAQFLLLLQFSRICIVCACAADWQAAAHPADSQWLQPIQRCLSLTCRQSLLLSTAAQSVQQRAERLTGLFSSECRRQMPLSAAAVFVSLVLFLSRRFLHLQRRLAHDVSSSFDTGFTPREFHK